MTTVLVTGGAGYVGSHACKALAQAGYVPVTFDNLSRGHASAVKWGPLEQGDLLDTARLAEVISQHRPVAVMHFAGLALVSESVAQPELYFKNNVEGTKNLLDAMALASVRHMGFSSTCAVYGNPDVLPIGENAPLRPISPYGESKLLIEQMLKERQSSDELAWFALRYFNAAGADPDGEIGENHDPEPHLIPNVLGAVMGRNKLIVNGNQFATEDGTCVRDYIHVADLAKAHVLALKLLRSDAPSYALNLGTGTGYSVLQVIHAAERVTGTTIPYEVGEPRPGDPPALVADGKESARVLSWQPERSDIDVIVADAWRWMQSQ